MSNSLNPVFGEWYTDRQLGSGTDGKVFSIYKEKYDGTKEKSVLKIIRLGENRGERKTFSPDENIVAENEEEYYSKIISNITDNIDTIMQSDKGRHFVRYEDYELRRASDGKGRLILLKLEQMRSLPDLLKDISFTLEETLRLGISVCKALIKCRSFGYIYPNLKPENILFDRNGMCKLGDFGTFSLLEPAKTSVAYKRTQYYMAPEFIKSGNINCTADTYSLGLVLYMLSNRGRLPFVEPYPEKVTISSLNESVQKRSKGEAFPEPLLASDELKKIISKACAFKANERYFTPEQMLSDLTNALNNKPFEEAKYDDIYSVTPQDAEEATEDVMIPTVEEVEKQPEQEIEVVSLKQEIKIPEIVPTYKAKPQPKKKAVRFEKLPDVKKRKAHNREAEQKLIRLIILTLILFVVMVASIALNASGCQGNIEAVAAVIYNNLIFPGGGALLYGC